MTKQDIIDYVMNTPHNTNRAVLKGMLEDISEDGGASMIVRMDIDGTTDKTWQQVYDALADGTLVYILSTFSSDSGIETDMVAQAPILMAVSGNNNFGAAAMSISHNGTSANTVMFIADSADGYLRAMEGSQGGGQ